MPAICNFFFFPPQIFFFFFFTYIYNAFCSPFFLFSLFFAFLCNSCLVVIPEFKALWCKSYFFYPLLLLYIYILESTAPLCIAKVIYHLVLMT
ncbi:hypothetical protein BZA77DRAFT_303301 [Pyronema omphalodes]|nr:hypothetical protein BZA77DRAFT_303301 [Pyronema omphalodes]